jgi:ferredoxin-type protein NapF
MTSDCLAARGVVCRSCGDSCPHAAIRFWPRIGGPALPEILDDACTGCGACVGVCPVSAIEVRERPDEARHD